jgi:hypothetical protein
MPETQTVYVDAYEYMKKRSDELGQLEAGNHEDKVLVNKELYVHLVERNKELGNLLCGEHPELVAINEAQYKKLWTTAEWYAHLECYGIDNSKAYQVACEEWDGDDE